MCVTTQVLYKDKVELFLLEFNSWVVQGNLDKLNFFPYFIFHWEVSCQAGWNQVTTNHEFWEQRNFKNNEIMLESPSFLGKWAGRRDLHFLLLSGGGSGRSQFCQCIPLGWTGMGVLPFQYHKPRS